MSSHLILHGKTKQKLVLPSPILFAKENVAAFSFIWLEINAGLQAEHFKCLENDCFGIQVWKIRTELLMHCSLFTLEK